MPPLVKLVVKPQATPTVKGTSFDDRIKQLEDERKQRLREIDIEAARLTKELQRGRR